MTQRLGYRACRAIAQPHVNRNPVASPAQARQMGSEKT